MRRGRGRGGRGAARGPANTTDQKRQPRIKAIGKGLVKAVLSGDTVVLSGVQKPGEPFPPEREVTISGVLAPRFARSKNAADEPWAWHSREFLRKKLLGRTVSFKLLHHHERDGRSRDYCSVEFDGTDLASLVVANGWAKVQPVEKDKKIHPEKQALLDLQAKAQSAQLGLHNQQVSSADKVRFFPTVNAIDLLDKFRNVPLPAVVDKIIDGSNLRVELLGDDSDPLKHFVINLRLAGVECEQTPIPPPFGQSASKSQPPKWGDKKQKDDEEADEEDADDEEEEKETPVKVEKPKPFAIEAQKYVEARLLHRDVKILLQGSDGNHPQANLYGTIQFEKGNITEKLLEQGLGRYVKWSANLTGLGDKLAAAEAVAKKARVGLHSLKGGVSSVSEIKGPRDFLAKVSQVISGDRVAVTEIEDPAHPAEPSTEEKKFPLASIRCARLGNRGGPNEDWALDAREWLRPKLLGKKVRVVIEYERDPLPEAVDQTKQQFVSLYINKQNINEGLVAAGLARVIPHRRNEERADNWDRLLVAEHKAQKAGLGLHGRSKPPLSTAIIDLTNTFGGRGGGRGGRGRGGRGRGNRGGGRGVFNEDGAETGATYRPVGEREDTKESGGGASRAKVFLSALKKTQHNALVEYVFSGSRFKLWVQDQHLICFFVLAGIRSPRNSDNSPNEWTVKATDFVRQRILQKTVAIETESTDRSEVNFVGNLFYNGQNLSLDLLREGLASVWDGSARQMEDQGAALYAAQKVAKDQKIGLWEKYVEEPPEEDWQEEEEEEEEGYEEAEGDGADSQRLRGGAEVKVKITEIVDACTFYVHIVDDPNVTLVEDAMKNYNEDGKELKAEDAKSGKVYAGLFPNEGTWHRVRLETKTQSGQWRGLFIDYGNRENLDLAQIRSLEEELARIPPTAHQMFLAALKAPGEGSEYFEPAGQAFSDLVWDRELNAHIEYADQGKYHVTLKKTGSDISINQLLVESAYIRVHPRPIRRLKEKGRGEYTPLYKAMLGFEEIAKSSRKHIWEYGDVSDEEEDARDDRGRVPSKKAKEKEAKEKEEKKAKEKEKESKKKAESKPKEGGKGGDKGGKGGDKGGKGGDKGGDKGKAAAPAAKGGKKK